MYNYYLIKISEKGDEIWLSESQARVVRENRFSALSLQSTAVLCLIATKFIIPL
jgi:hypothetical protein